MKFGFVVTNLAGGGAEKAILKIAAALTGRGHEVHLLLLEHLIEHDIPANVAVDALSHPGRRISKGALGKRVAAWRLRRAVRRLSRATPFDIVISTLPFADEVAILAKLPRHWCRIANTLSAEIARLRDTRKAERRLARYRRLYAQRPLIAVSDGVAHDLRTEIGLTQTRIERIYNPFDFAAIRAQAQEASDRPAFPYVIHVGRFAAQKRHDVLLDAWARVETSHRLVLLTEPAPALQAMIDARGLEARVTIVGFQPNPYPWIAGAELLVLSSDHEGLPNVIIEALVLGVPVVSTDCPSGPREILGDENSSWLVPVNDPARLADAITRAFADRPDPARVDLSRFDIVSITAGCERLAVQARGLLSVVD